MPKVKGTPNVKFNLFDKRAAETYIHLFFHYSQGRLKMATGHKVRTAFWDWEKQRAKLDRRYPEHSDINNDLDKLTHHVKEAYRENGIGQISPEALKDEVEYRMEWKPRPIDPRLNATLLDYAKKYCDQREAQPNANKGTIKTLRKIQHMLEAYAAERGRKLRFNEITLDFFHDFKAWMFAAPRSYNSNYVGKVFGFVRSFMNAAKYEGLHTNEVFHLFKVDAEEVTKIALSFAELEHLYHMDLSENKRLEKVRDLFLVGAYTGLRFSDFSRISPEHIIERAGKTWVKILTMKTAKTVTIPMFPILGAILEKYNFKVPTISGQKLNDYLKELGRLAGFTQKIMVVDSRGGTPKEVEQERWELLSSHVARRSFATNFIKHGIPAVDIMPITGHTSEAQFKKYIAIDADTRADMFAKRAAEIPMLKEPKLKVVS